jgi:type I protein arginine methyltransferase
VNPRYRSELFEFAVTQLLRLRHVLFARRSLARALRAAERRNVLEDLSLHEHMLADSVRLGAYRAAIERYVNSRDCVADIGTGTGVLAFLAAARNPRKVFAVERSKLLLDYARAAAAANGIDNVSFIASSSHKFRPAEPIDVIIQEQMGIGLFDEGMVESIIDVRDRCLKPGGKILPARFEFYLEPVQLLAEECVPMVWERPISGFTFPRPLTKSPEASFREIARRQIDFPLCQPSPAFAFDLTTLTRDELPRRFSVRKPVKRLGQLDGICIYFRAIFDNEIAFSTGPDAVRTHWPMLFYRTPARAYQPSQIFSLEVEVPDLSDYLEWSWHVGSE